MKERVTLRLYDDPSTPPACEGGRYTADPKLGGGAYQRGDTVPLDERDGGRLFGVIEEIGEQPQADDAGAYRLAVVWTQD